MEFKNILKFTEWYKEKAKDRFSKFFIINELLEEVEEQYYISGMPEYELSSYESKSGNPELYRYEIHLWIDPITEEYNYKIIF